MTAGNSLAMTRAVDRCPIEDEAESSRAMYSLGTIGVTDFPEVPTNRTDTGSAAKVTTR